MSKEDFSLEIKKEQNAIPRVNFRRPDLSYIERKESGASKFVGLSAALHIGLIVALLSMSASFLETPKLEIVTVDLSEKVGPKAIPDGIEEALPSQGAPMAAAPTPSLDTTPEPLEEPTIAPPPPPPARPKAVAVAKPTPAPVVRKAAPVAKVAAKAAPSPREDVPAQIDDIESPVLVAPPVAEEKSIDPEEIDTAVAKVDEDHQKELASAQAQLDEDAKQVDQEQERQLEEAKAKVEQEKAAMAAKADALKRKNALAAAAAVQAAQQAAAARAAQEEAEAAGRAREKAAQEGKGSGDNGAMAAAPAQGTPGGVRTLEQLRQMPGNPKPSYSEQERLANQSGDAVFLAYIDRSGLPTQFRQTRSTGHANLDQKTVDALKQWKFYPGQEGWVEIPIHWDIKGGPQERSALGQRKTTK